MRSHTQRLMVCAASFAALCMGLAGCGSNTASTGGDSGEVVNLTYMHRLPDSEGMTLVKDIVAKWNKDHPNIQVKATKFDGAAQDMIKKLETDVKAGNIFAGLANASDPWYTVKNDAWVVNTNGSGSQAFAETFQELIDNKATLTNPRWVPSFDASLQDGTLIGNIGAAWEAPLFKDSAGDTGKGDWRVTQIGDWFGNGTSTGPDGGSGVAVLKGCEHKAEAMEFLDWFNTQVEDLTSQGLIVAANTETAKTPESWSEFYGGQDVMKEFATANDNMVAFNYMPGYSAVASAMKEAADKATDGSGKVADVFPVAQQTSIDTLKNYGLSVAK